MRYQLRDGEFGFYFYDNNTSKPIGLQSVLDRLNKYDQNYQETRDGKGLLTRSCKNCKHIGKTCCEFDPYANLKYCSRWGPKP